MAQQSCVESSSPVRCCAAKVSTDRPPSLFLSGEFEIFLKTTRGAVRNRSAGGIRGLFGGLKTVLEKAGGCAKLADVGAAQLRENERILRNADDVILGEMTCMNRYPRSATVIAPKPAGGPGDSAQRALHVATKRGQPRDPGSGLPRTFVARTTGVAAHL